jgi:hypothetical protein
MSIELQMENAAGYMLARFIGEGKAEEALLSFEQIAEQCKRTNNKNLLIDCTKAKTDDVSIVDMYEQGEGAKLFNHYGIKIAVVVPDEKLEPEKFAEMVARNRGVNACVFTDYQTAEEWLLKMMAQDRGVDACVLTDYQAAVE